MCKWVVLLSFSSSSYCVDVLVELVLCERDARGDADIMAHLPRWEGEPCLLTILAFDGVFSVHDRQGNGCLLLGGFFLYSGLMGMKWCL